MHCLKRSAGSLLESSVGALLKSFCWYCMKRSVGACLKSSVGALFEEFCWFTA